METLKLFKRKVNVLIALAVALPFFSLNFYLLLNLPANIGFACSLGGYFTVQNIMYAGLYAFIFGILIVGIIEIFKRKIDRIKVASTGIFSLTIAFLTTVCTLCVLPALSIFGINMSLAIFTTYNYYFKMIALAVLLISIFLIEINLKKSCLLSKFKIHV